MDRKMLETQGLTAEQIEVVMAENGKDIQAEQAKAKTATTDAVAKATEPLQAQITKLTTQNGELQETIKNTPGVDDAAKTKVDELTKAHDKEMKELQKKHDEDLSLLKRQADTKEFLASLSKKFVTPETQKVFEERLNAALVDKAYEGKNRADILAAITLGEDGKERTDIYAPASTTQAPEVTGGTNPPPGEQGGAKKTIPTII